MQPIYLIFFVFLICNNATASAYDYYDDYSAIPINELDADTALEIRNAVKLGIIQSAKCFDQMVSCKTSKCSNCSAFFDCCSDVCSHQSTKVQPNFICDDDAGILDCKCKSECFDEALDYRLSNCYRFPDREKFNDCCSQKCPKSDSPHTVIIQI